MSDEDEPNTKTDWVFVIFWVVICSLFCGSAALGIEFIWRLIHG